MGGFILYPSSCVLFLMTKNLYYFDETATCLLCMGKLGLIFKTA